MRVKTAQTAFIENGLGLGKGRMGLVKLEIIVPLYVKKSIIAVK